MGFPVVWVIVVAGLALVVAALAVALLAWRRHHLLHAGGVDVAMRVGVGGRGWHLGVAHYRGEEFAWYRALSLRSGPSWVLNRSSVEIASRREPSTAETYTMPSGSTVLGVTGLGRDVELAMGPDALTGFLSWLESAPPGKSVPWAS